MKKCLIVIDYQYDFVAEDGKLTAGINAVLIENNIARKAQNYLDNGDGLYFTLDTHTEKDWNNHPESKSFPIHCVEGTNGWELYGKLNKFMNEKSKLIRKKAYCPNFDFLNNIVNEYDQIELAGVVTDICVLQTAIGIYTAAVCSGRNINICIDSRCCAAFDNNRHEQALKYMYDIIGVKKE